jgi:hypothetical protein
MKHDESEQLRALQKERPQPIDYGLTYDDLNLYSDLRTTWWCRLGDGKPIQCLGTRPDAQDKQGRRWFSLLILRDWTDRERRGYTAGGLALWLLLFGGLCSANPHSFSDSVLGFVFLGVGAACLLYAIVPGVLLKSLRTRASTSLEAYWTRFGRSRAANSC